MQPKLQNIAISCYACHAADARSRERCRSEAGEKHAEVRSFTDTRYRAEVCSECGVPRAAKAVREEQQSDAVQCADAMRRPARHVAVTIQARLRKKVSPLTPPAAVRQHYSSPRDIR
jgi:hypothetical protein